MPLILFQKLICITMCIEILILKTKMLTGHGVDLIGSHLFGRFDARHLEDDLLEDEQVQRLLALQLVGHVLQDAGQLDVVLLEDGSAKVRQRLQPEGYAEKQWLIKNNLRFVKCFSSLK